jgi:hypothetical protein
VVVLDGLRTLSVTLFLLVAGLEIDLTRISRCGKSAVLVGLSGIAVPFALGWVTATSAPELVGYEPRAGHGLVVYRALLRHGIVHQRVAGHRQDADGSAAVQDRLRDDRRSRRAILNDLAGWIVFANHPGDDPEHGHRAERVGDRALRRRIRGADVDGRPLDRAPHLAVGAGARRPGRAA